MPANPITLQPDATSLLIKLRNGELTAESMVEQHLSVLKRLHPAINGATTIFEKEALAQAKQLDDSGNKNLPLFGLPCSVKETFAIAGEEITAGSLRRPPDHCDSDAPMVQRLRDAGAVIIARSNIPEFAMTGESTNLRFGRCNNPHDVNRVAGGSSGGEGALVGCGSTVFGLGSDVLGSIRIPAALCGTVGFKAHSTAIDNSGTWPLITGNTKSWLAFGPLCRTVRDAQLIYNVIAREPVAETNELFSRLLVPEGFPIKYRQSCIQDAVTNAKQCLLDTGLKSDTVQFSKVPKLFLQIPRIIIDDFYDKWIADLSAGSYGAFSPYKELLAQLTGKATIDRGLLNWILMQPLMKSRRPGKRQRIADEFTQAKQEYRQLIGADGVVVLPTLGLVAPKHKGFNRASLLDPRVNGLFTSHTLGNYLDLPTITIPAWKHCDETTGLPASVSLMCNPGSEDKLFATAKIVEAALN